MEERQPIFLYVEDDPASCTVMTVMIQQFMGYSNLTIFDTSDHFIDRVHGLTSAPDVVFLDIQMVPHDGYALLDLLRGDEKYRSVKVIALTASVMAIDLERLRTAGFDGVIGKPIRKKFFPELVKRILKGESVWFVS